MCVCVCACVRACVRARARVRVCVVVVAVVVVFVLLVFVVVLTPLPTPLSRAHYCVVCSFPALHFGVTTMSSASRIEHHEAHSFAFWSRKKCMVIALIFVTGCFYLCGVNI